MGFEAEYAERDGGADVSGREDCDGGVELDSGAELARNDDLAGAEPLGFAKRDAALLLEVVPHPPFAVDPDARRVDLAGELPVGIPMLVVRGGEADAERELNGEGRSEPAGGKSRRE